MKKRNGACPICYARSLVTPKEKKIPTLYNQTPFENGLAKTPPMGWNSWNVFKENIDETMLYEMAKAMVDSGLLDAGYNYFNLDDCWEAKARNVKGELVSDPITFPSGIKSLAEKVNALGLKLGIYSCNGPLTCQHFPGSQGYEYRDAYTFASWGVEYWKLDYCHNVPFTDYAPLVAGIAVSEKGVKPTRLYSVEEGTRYGNAHIFATRYPKKRYNSTQRFKKHCSGLDRAEGKIEWQVEVEKDGEYVLTVYTHELYPKYEKLLGVQVNDKELYLINIPKEIVHWQEYITQKIVSLKAGKNKISLFNPINNRSTGDMLQFQHAGKCIKQATADYAKDAGVEEKPIVFSICEWGSGEPHLWGKSAGNLWRTTGDIYHNWNSIKKLYEHNVELYPYADVGHWNDPDMLEVGVGNFTYNENEAHFALWCMMASPLLLGNDIRSMSEDVLKIIANKHLIAIDQDALGKQAKRIVKASVDVLVRPLSNGKTAICYFNKTDSTKTFSFDENIFENESYIDYNKDGEIFDCLTAQSVDKSDMLSGKIPARSVKVFTI